MTRNHLLKLACLVLAPAAIVVSSCTEAPENIATQSAALTVPSSFIDEVFASGVGEGTAMDFAPDGRLFVAQKTGQMRVVKNGVLLPTPFFSVTVNSEGERGLLGVAFDPAFNANHFVYTYYTSTSGSTHNRISRFTANGDVAVPGSETVLADLETLSSATNHNGGSLHFGIDGKLYVAVGNNAINSNSQSLTSRLGKMLRLNSDGTIPSDNPFFTQTTGVFRAIWAQGLRNPFTFSVQPGTGKLFIDDVGENTWEEIDPGIPGANYGWPDSEGNSNLKANETGPVYAYAHSGGACAITGGTFYNPTTVQFPSTWVGNYFFADYCAGWIKRLDPATKAVTDFASGGSSIVDLKVGPDGALYYLARGGGIVGRIRSGTAQAPVINTQPMSQAAGIAQPVTFNVAASGSIPLGYQWQRNGANIADATTSSYTITSTTIADNGAQFRVVVSNPFGTVTSNSATLTVVGQAPTATITAPINASPYSANQTIAFAGTGTDPEDGTLPASAFSWTILFHHDTHTHPFLGPINGVKSGTFVIPNKGEVSTDVWYRLHLTVTDSNGLVSTTFVDVNPLTVNLSLATNPAGLQVTLDGQPVTTPASIGSVVGMIRTLGVVSPQSQGGANYVFGSWSDGGALSHDITTPASDTSYTATYAVGAASGLAAEYYDNIDLTNLKLTRTDPAVSFDWGTGSPDASIAVGTYSVRWTGTVTPLFSQTYTFFAATDDGVRLWVNGQLLVDRWVNQPTTEASGTIALTAGQPYSIRMEYFQNGGGAVARLSWSSASQAKQIVPPSQLAPGSPPPPPPPSFPIKVNFQPASAAVPAGYLVDSGDVFGPHGNVSYGWSTSHTDLTRERNVNADQRLDTLCHMHAGAKWEVAVPNGTYQVLVSVGDPGFVSTYTLNVEGTSYWNAAPLGVNQFLSATKSIAVSDGRITFDQGSAANMSTRIDYVEISQ